MTRNLTVHRRCLEERLRGERTVTDVLMLRSADLTVDDAAYRQTLEDVAGKITALGPKIVSATPSYYQTGDESQVSQNRRSTIVPVVLAGGTAEAEEHIAEVHSIVDNAVLPAGFELFITGEATLAREFTVGAEEDLLRGEAIGIPVALIILAVVFGAVVAAIIPLILAIVAIVVAIGSVAIIGQVVEMNVFCAEHDHDDWPRRRHRLLALYRVPLPLRSVRATFPIQDAIALAGATASRAVFFSGVTVVLALAGLLIVPMNIFVSLGLGAITVVVSAVAAGLTLLPAVLSVMGDRVDRLEIWIPGLRKKCRGAKCADEEAALSTFAHSSTHPGAQLPLGYPRHLR